MVKGIIAGFGCFILVGIPYLMGYMVRCGKYVLNGNDRLPDWESYDDFFPGGIRAFIILFLYGILSTLISEVIRYFAPSTNGLPLAEYLFVISIMSIVITLVSLPVLMMAGISLMIFIDTGDFHRALDPRNSYRLLVYRPLEFIKAAVLQYVLGFVIALPFNMLFWFTIGISGPFFKCCITVLLLFLTLGVLLYITLCYRTFIWAKFYRRVTGGSIDRLVAESPFD